MEKAPGRILLKAAGIASIALGGFLILSGIGSAVHLIVIRVQAALSPAYQVTTVIIWTGAEEPSGLMQRVPPIVWIMARQVFFAVAGAFALAAGIMSLRRRGAPDKAKQLCIFAAINIVYSVIALILFPLFGILWLAAAVICCIGAYKNYREHEK